MKNRTQSICIHPWSHLAFDPDGSMIPCCHANDAVLGNINKDSVDEVFNGEKMNAIRKSMINGKMPEDVCKKCIYLESINAKSPRHKAFTHHYANKVEQEIVANTNHDGSLKDYKIRFWDLRYSNRCNMSCIMCAPKWSHKWTAEIKKLDSMVHDENEKHKLASALVYDREEVLNMPKVLELSNHTDWIDNGIHDVEHIYFAGGEPLIMDEHWYILKKLDEYKRYDVKIKYNTNMLKLDYRGESVIDYWKKWKRDNLFVECSIDETGVRAEYIRNGTVWKTIKNNIKSVIDAGIKINPIISVGCYNVHRLPDLVEELKEIFGQQDNKLFRPSLNIVYTKAYSMSVWPDKQRKQIRKILKRWEKNTFNIVPNQLKPIYNQLEKEHDPTAAKNFLRKSAILDYSRGKNIFNSIPELEIVNSLYDNLYTKTLEQCKEVTCKNGSADTL